MREDIERVREAVSQVTRVAVITGAGVSAESGVPTFRGKEGLWRNYDPMVLATPEAFARDPKLVWEWYDWRRGIIASRDPNAGHEVLVSWEEFFPEFALITQNIDGLHQRAGSQNVIELHGNIWKHRCVDENTIVENHDVPLKEIPPQCEKCGALMRPHVVWFGESLDGAILQKSFQLSSGCDVMFSIGTSAVVQPAASLPLSAAEAGVKVIEINPDPTPISGCADFSFRAKSGEFLPILDEELRKRATKKRG